MTTATRGLGNCDAGRSAEQHTGRRKETSNGGDARTNETATRGKGEVFEGKTAGSLQTRSIPILV